MEKRITISTLIYMETPEERHRMEEIIGDVLKELGHGDDKYGHHPGPKRGYGTLRQELAELKTELDAENATEYKIRKEAIQVAAMSLKFLRDCCGRRK